jgi:hypothetical protein
MFVAKVTEGNMWEVNNEVQAIITKPICSDYKIVATSRCSD